MALREFGGLTPPRGGEGGAGRTEGAGRQHRQSGAHDDLLDPSGAGMDRGRRGHLPAARVVRTDGGAEEITGAPAMRRRRLRPRLAAVILLVALAMRPQVSHRLSAISGGAAL